MEALQNSHLTAEMVAEFAVVEVDLVAEKEEGFGRMKRSWFV